MSLSDLKIRNLKPKDKKYKVSDYAGLYLLIMPNGSKYFKYDYSFDGVRKTYSLGVYPNISLKNAREELINVKQTLHKGINPNIAKKIGRYTSKANTLQEVAEEWFKKNKDKWIESHAQRKWYRLNANVLIYIGTRPIKEITVQELLSVIRIMEDRKVYDTAHRVNNIVKEVFSYAIATGIVDRNIALDISGALSAKKPVTHRAAITEPKKIGELMRAIDGYEGNFISKMALKLAPYVMLRPNEIASAEWSEIDFDRKLWKIPAHKMKMKRTHIIPLSKQAMNILENMIPQVSKYIFPSLRTKTSHITPCTLNAAIRRLGFSGDEMTAHGFRGMASTILYENGFTEDIVEMQLAHVESNQVKAAYNHARYIDRRTEMMQWLADYLDNLRDNI